MRTKAQIRQAAEAQASPASHDSLVHELQAHQIELEMQNKQLQAAQEALQAAQDKYMDLYDYATVGYVTFLSKPFKHDDQVALVSQCLAKSK